MNIVFSLIAACGLILFGIIVLGGMLGLLSPALSLMGAVMGVAVVFLACEGIEQ
jgi:hypothetical protein